MIILSGDKKQIIDSRYVERFCIVEKSDAALIVASYGADRPPVTIAKYADIREARPVLEDLFYDLGADKNQFTMPESVLFSEERQVHDARTRRKGGS